MSIIEQIFQIVCSTNVITMEENTNFFLSTDEQSDMETKYLKWIHIKGETVIPVKNNG